MVILEPFDGLACVEASQWDVINRFGEWLVALGLFSLNLYFVPIIAAAILLPVSGILGLAIAAVFVMPLVLRHVSQRDYATVQRQGKFATAVSVWNAVWVCVVFAVGWVLTLQLWLVPPHGRGAVAILVGVCVFTHDAFGRDSGTRQPRRTPPFIAAP